MSLVLIIPTLVLSPAHTDAESVTHTGAFSRRAGAVAEPVANGGPALRGLSAPGGFSALASTDPDASCVMQGGTDIGTVTPLTTDEDVVAFYSYGSPAMASYNGSYATQSGDSMIFVHRDNATGVRSLVVVHDRSYDGSGGQVHMEISGLGVAASVVVEDDPGMENLAAGLDGLGNAVFDWQWAPCCTDGVAVEGVDWDSGCVTVDLGLALGIDTWSFVDGETLDRIPLDPTTPLQICPGDCNACPSAAAGPPQTVECTGDGLASVTLDGSASSDPDDDPLSYAWSIDGGSATASGEVASVVLALGAHDAVLTVSDGVCEDMDATEATVQDTLAPAIDECPSDVTLVLDAATCTASLDASALGNDVCQGPLGASHHFDFAAPGSQAHTYVLTDASGNSSSCDQIVSAVDLTPPVLVCPPDQTVVLSADTCEASVIGEVTGLDACDGPVAQSHVFYFGAQSSETWAYVVTDASGNTATCTQTVTAVDLTPPVYTPGPTVSLWAPNHKYVTSTLGQCGSAEDVCAGPLDLDGGAATITSLASSEPDDVGAGGDGHTTGDARIIDGHTIALRGERQGKGGGRAYSIGMRISDGSANVIDAQCTVVVEHDQGNNP